MSNYSDQLRDQIANQYKDQDERKAFMHGFKVASGELLPRMKNLQKALNKAKVDVARKR